MHRAARHFPFLRWPRPDAALLRNEISAGLTVAVVMIPQSVAYAGLAGMPLVAGLYATFLPMLVAVLFSQSTRLSVGPSALSSVLIGSSLIGLAEPGSAQWVALAVWLALLSGALQLLVGASGGAWMLNLVSSPVMAGFTQAAALLIIASQLPDLLGLASLRDLLHGALPHAETLAYGLGGIAVLVLGKRYLPRVPMVLLLTLAAAGISAATGFAGRGRVIGTLPAGLPSLYLPPLGDWDTLSSLLMPALVLALVSSLEMAASARIENQRAGRRWDANQDLIGQGLGKISSGLCGSFATSTSFSRSALTLYAGAKTGWATVAACAIVLLVLLFLTPLLAQVPRAILSAVVIAAVSSLFKPRSLLALRRIDKVESVTAFVTFGVTLASSPRIYWGVLTGVLMGLAHFLYHRLHPRIIEVGLHPDGSLRDRHLWHLPPLAPDTFAMRMDSGLDFAAASAFEKAIVDHIAAHPEVRRVCIFAQPINRIDATGVETFLLVRSMLVQHGITLHISGMKLPVEQVLRRTATLDGDPLLQMWRTDAEALEALGTATARDQAPGRSDGVERAGLSSAAATRS